MKKRRRMQSKPPAELRERAEKLAGASRADIAAMSPEEVQTLVHELQVHQIELQLQNEELRQAQVELSDSRDRYSELYEFAPVGYVTLDPDGKILSANLTMAGILGVPRSRLTGKPLSKFVTVSSQDALYLHRQAIFSRAETDHSDDTDTQEGDSSVDGFNRHSCDLEVVSTDGSILCVRLKSQLASGGDAAPYCRMTLSDITQQKIAERQLVQLNKELEQRVTLRTAELTTANEELLLTSQRLQTLLDSVNVVISEWDLPTMRPTFVSQQAKQVFGFPLNDWFEKPDFWQNTVLHPDDCGAAERLSADQSLATSEYELEYRARHADGHVIWIHEFVHAMTSRSGEPKKLACVMMDITARKQMELALRTTSEKLKAILNTATDAIITINEQGIMQDLNPAALTMFGYEVNEVVGQNVSMLMPEPYRDEHDSYLQNYRKTGEAHIIGTIREVSGQRKDGSTFPADLAVNAVDHLGLFAGIVRDTTERYRLQREVLNIAASEQRRFGQDLHDGLGQELAGLAIMTDTLTKILTREGHAAATQAAQIFDALKRASRVARDMAHGLVAVDIDSHGLMVALDGLAKRIDQLENLHCSFNCPTPVLFGNNETAMQLFRIAQEACSNAIRHGSPQRLQIDLEKQDNLGILKIHDDGRGIDRTESSLNGTGFGLRIMRYRANLIGGLFTIQRTSEDGGTTVTCSVPLKNN